MESVDFVPGIQPPAGDRGAAYWFIFQGDRLLVRQAGDSVTIPLASRIAELGIAPLRQLYLGYLQDPAGRQLDCYCAEIPAETTVPKGMTVEGLRQVAPQLGDRLFGLAGRAIQIIAWDRTYQYCGQCGTHTERMDNERARRCPRCGLISYPRLSPAIIIAVVRETGEGKQLLLARNHRFPSGRYSVLAGYVEPGESLEDCAHREVMEEVGIRIRDVRYFGSQPWPFPNSLMIGFTAVYDEGELAPEASELADARWFAAGELPDLPPSFTIARQLIEWFLENGGTVATAQSIIQRDDRPNQRPLPGRAFDL